MANVSKFVELIKKLEGDDSVEVKKVLKEEILESLAEEGIFKYDDELLSQYKDEDFDMFVVESDLTKEIESLADQLIIKNGKPDYSMITLLKREYNIYVGPGEIDSFGWLTGVIHTSKGYIVFG